MDSTEQLMDWLLIIHCVNNSGQFWKRDALSIDSSLLREFSPVCSCLPFSNPYLFPPALATLLLLCWFGYHNLCSTDKHFKFPLQPSKKSMKMDIIHFIIKYSFSLSDTFNPVSCTTINFYFSVYVLSTIKSYSVQEKLNLF